MERHTSEAPSTGDTPDPQLIIMRPPSWPLEPAACPRFVAEDYHIWKFDFCTYTTDNDPRTTALLREYMRYLCREYQVPLYHGSIEIPSRRSSSISTTTSAPDSPLSHISSSTTDLEIPGGDWSIVFGPGVYKSLSWFLAFGAGNDSQTLWYWVPERPGETARMTTTGLLMRFVEMLRKEGRIKSSRIWGPGTRENRTMWEIARAVGEKLNGMGEGERSEGSGEFTAMVE